MVDKGGLRDTAREYGISTVTLSQRGKELGYLRGAGHRRSRLALPQDVGVFGYLAGIIDGEGSLITDHHGRWRIHVVNTDIHLVDWLKQIGGKAYLRSARGRLGKRPIYAWVVDAQREVEEILRAVSPYMRIKHDKARRALRDIKAVATKQLKAL